METEVYEAFVAAAMKAMEQWGGKPARAEPAGLDHTRTAPQGVSALVALVGSVGGLLLLTVDQATAASFARRALGPSAETVPGLSRSVVAELANLIASGGASRLASAGYSLTVTVPQPLSPGEEFLAQPALFRVVSLRSGSHSITLRFHLRDASTSVASLQGQRLVEVAEILNHSRLRAVLQPVMDLRTGRIVGYEALLRGPEGPLEQPDELFRAAEAAGILPALERAARKTALRSGRWVLEQGMELSLNIDARVPLLDDRCPLTGLLAEDGSWVRRVVLEVTERTVLNRDLDFLSALERYRAAGGRVALDDLGAGDSGLQALLAVRPDMVKLDRALTAGMDRGGWRLALVEGLVAAAHRVGAVVVAEGIETVEDLRAARRAGVDFVQGYLVGRPSLRPPLTVGVEVLEALARLG